MTKFTYADLRGDTPFVPPTPAEVPAEPEKSIASLERRYPELVRKIQEASSRLGRERGKVTSDDVWEVCPIPAGIEPRIMSVAFRDKRLWRQTGQYVKTRRPSRHKAPIAVWEYRQHGVAA